MLQSPERNTEVVAKGWVRTKRENKQVAFIALNDGSTIHNIQVVVDVERFDEELLKRIATGACVKATGLLVDSPASGQPVEIQATGIELYGGVEADYPLQKKGHTLEFLREIAHLRPRTNTFGAVFRVRHAMAYAIHKYFNDKGFYYWHSPIVTGSDAEGAGAMFRVTTLPLEQVPIAEHGVLRGCIKLNGLVNKLVSHLADYEGDMGSDSEFKKGVKEMRQLWEKVLSHHMSVAMDAQDYKTENGKAPRFAELDRSYKRFMEHATDVIRKSKEAAELTPAILRADLGRMHMSMDILVRYRDWGDTVDFGEDFFGRSTNLTVSGQLEGELGAMALGQIYTFGPTFRAENSNTPRHLAEFWMIEPEMAFYEIEENMDLAEDFIKYLVRYALDHCADDLAFLEKMYDKELTERLRFVTANDFVRLDYTEGIKILEEAQNKGRKFEFPVSWGLDLQSEHERYLVEEHFEKPVILTNYPKDIKAFYMKQNDDGKTVRAMDVLFPKIGEIIGGSQREEDYGKLVRRMEEMDVPMETMRWYLDTRRFGTAPHSGFGLGFERLVLFVTGMANIRDVIPFPRTPGNAEF